MRIFYYLYLFVMPFFFFWLIIVYALQIIT